MKRVGTLLLVFLISANGFAQESKNNVDSTIENEAVLSISYVSGGLGFGLFYKRQVAEKRYFRLQLADIYFSRQENQPVFSNQFPSNSEQFSANLELGVEWRFHVHSKVALYTGIDVILGATHYANRVQDPSLPANQRVNQDFSLRAGLAANSGIMVTVHEFIKVGLNLSPDVFYTWSPWDYQDGFGNVYRGQSHGISTSIGSGSVQATIVFRWDSQRKKRLEESP